MSLDRFVNKEDLLNKVNQSPPNKWSEALQASGLLTTFNANKTFLDMNFNDTTGASANIEAHLYTTNNGSYIDSVYNLPIIYDSTKPLGGTIHVDTKAFAEQLSVRSGNYLVVFNLHKPFDLTGAWDNPAFNVMEISPDRTELYLRANPNYSQYQELIDMRESYIGNPMIDYQQQSGNIVINFGKGRIGTIVNQEVWTESDSLVVKLLKPLDQDVTEDDKCWIEWELADSLIAFIHVAVKDDSMVIQLRSPNFDANQEYNTITETDFQNFSELLGSSTTTSEQIIQNMLSGSFAGSPIGVDYSGLQNFVFYSSAAERLANFKYKIQQIEFYDEQLNLLNDATQTSEVIVDKQNALTRRTNIIGSFDGFEKWLYNEPTSSLFTHQTVYDNAHESGNPTRLEGGLLGSDVYQIQPYPKFLSSSYGSGEYVVHHSTSSIAETWYSGFMLTASLYDELNDKSLIKILPEHIRQDSNNNQFELFVHMIGQHFDILYSYADALARTYHPIEHPKLGHTKETIYNVAKSLGWKLFDGKQASALWQYSLGKSETGSLASTGSIFTKPDEAITTEVWRRIVNNLPYLLKTKGTARGIKALMNTYGIPQTLLSIREYGGPKVGEDLPTLIEDRFSYALPINGTVSTDSTSGNNQFLFVGRRKFSSSFAGWGIPGVENPTFKDNLPDELTGSAAHKLDIRVPDTIEFRYKPGAKKDMTLYSMALKNPLSSATATAVLGLQYTASYSGSDKYGRMYFQMSNGKSVITEHDNDVAGANKWAKFTDWAPIYDGDFWNVRLWTEFPWITSSGTTTSYENRLTPNIYWQTQKASDYINGKVIHRVSASMYPGTGSNIAQAGLNQTRWVNSTTSGSVTGHEHHMGTATIGGHTGVSNISTGTNTIVSSSTFSGSIQEYREWMEVLDQRTFDIHTLNPTSYVSSISPTSSYDTLIRHYPLGTDLRAGSVSGSKDGTYTAQQQISSSHPASIRNGKPFYNDYFTAPDDNFTTDHQALKSDAFYQSGYDYGHPNGILRAINFPDPGTNQRGNFEPIEETYYVQGASLGATLPKSEKIRFDDNELITRLSPNATAEQSRFDYASLDSNKLGLFYSIADQINKEIFNHIGDVALDDFVGDPDDQYEYEYNDLTHFAKEYWKKYADRNDVNAFMRIFSQFDFALFESIKQMIPDRADEALGLLIEPNILERAKEVPFKKPEYEPAHYETRVPGLSPTASGAYPYYEGTMSGSQPSSGETLFHVGDNGYEDIGNYRGNMAPRSSSTDYFTKQIFPLDERPSVTSSILNVYSVIQGGGVGSPTGVLNQADTTLPAMKRDSDFRWALGSGSAGRLKKAEAGFLAQNNTEAMGPTSNDWIGAGAASDILRVQFDTYLQTDTIQDLKINLTHALGQAGPATGSIFIRLVATKDNQHAAEQEVSASAILHRFIAPHKHFYYMHPEGVTGHTGQDHSVTFTNVHIPRRTNISVDYFVYNPSGSIVAELGGYNAGATDFLKPKIDKFELIQTINKAGYSAQDDIIDVPRPSSIFKLKQLHFHESDPALTNQKNDSQRVLSESLHRALFRYGDDALLGPSQYVYSHSLQDTHYRDDDSIRANAKFMGSQITAPGINVPSGYAELEYEPIVEIFITNPNQVVYNQTPAVTQTGQENPGNISITGTPPILVNRPARPLRR